MIKNLEIKITIFVRINDANKDFIFERANVHFPLDAVKLSDSNGEILTQFVRSEILVKEIETIPEIL
ncbi:MAG: hypothetical protein Q7R95_11225 [bacterium]|nr:hypothetical protein [bacterium]